MIYFSRGSKVYTEEDFTDSLDMIPYCVINDDDTLYLIETFDEDHVSTDYYRIDFKNNKLINKSSDEELFFTCEKGILAITDGDYVLKFRKDEKATTPPVPPAGEYELTYFMVDGKELSEDSLDYLRKYGKGDMLYKMSISSEKKAHIYDEDDDYYFDVKDYVFIRSNKIYPYTYNKDRQELTLDYPNGKVRYKFRKK